MKAIILAGGLGTRISEETSTRPSPRAGQPRRPAAIPRPEQDRHAPAVRGQPDAPALYEGPQLPHLWRADQHRHRDERLILDRRVSRIEQRDVEFCGREDRSVFWREFPEYNSRLKVFLLDNICLRLL